jgi:hypothetical protein
MTCSFLLTIGMLMGAALASGGFLQPHTQRHMQRRSVFRGKSSGTGARISADNLNTSLKQDPQQHD